MVSETEPLVKWCRIWLFLLVYTACMIIDACFHITDDARYTVRPVCVTGGFIYFQFHQLKRTSNKYFFLQTWLKAITYFKTNGTNGTAARHVTSGAPAPEKSAENGVHVEIEVVEEPLFHYDVFENPPIPLTIGFAFQVVVHLFIYVLSFIIIHKNN